MKQFILTFICATTLLFSSACSADEVTTTPEVVIPPASETETLEEETLSPPPVYNEKRAKDFESINIPENLAEFEKELKAVDRYLSSFKDLQAEFVQYSGNNSSVRKGKFYIKRPGMTRWEYAAPKPAMLFINEDKLVFYDLELDQVSYKDIPETPLREVLFNNTSILSDKIRILDIFKREDTFNITLTTADNVNDKEKLLQFERLILVFDPQPLELARVHLVDTKNRMTIYELKHIEMNTGLKESLFKFIDRRPLKGKRK